MAMVLSRSTKTLALGGAVGLALGALTNIGLLPLGSITGLLGGGPVIMGEATEANFETYEAPGAMAAIYNNSGYEDAEYGDLHLKAYAVNFADAVRQVCGNASAFKTAEVEAMRNKTATDMIDSMTPEVVGQALMDQLQRFGRMAQDPQAGMREMIPSYDPNAIPGDAQQDGARFAQEFGCQGGTMNRFAGNLRSYMKQGSQAKPNAERY